MEKIQVRPKILLVISVAIALACGLLALKVNVNSDMTKYLPDSSRMKQGIDILSSEFGQDPGSAAADVRIMMELPEGDEALKKAVGDSIARMDGVDAVSVASVSGHTLYELNVAKSVHQKRLAKHIKETFPYNAVTQTSQDGNTPDSKALVLAVACLIIILLVMSKSFLEPVLFLITTGMAVAVNMGTNAFLPSVSITTHSIAAVLQLALSMDYSIILMSRYRQQRELTADKYEAMAVACRKAAPAILSSAFTTVVGLLMLVFMNLKIGVDLGVVLAKGVVCSLIYAYIALPGLILLCENGIRKTEKKAPLPRTDGLADFCYRFRIPLTVAFVLILVLSYQFSTRTPISFSTSTPSAIDKVFPKKNTVVVLYDNDREDDVVALLDKVALNPEVEDIFSYPTLMKKRLTAEEMVATLQAQAAVQGREGAEMLTPDLLRICYYAKFGDPDLKVGFTDLVDFITAQTDNPLLSQVDIPDLGEKLEMLDAIREMSAASSLIINDNSLQEHISGPVEDLDAGDEVMTVHEYMKLLNAQQNTADTRMLLNLTDPVKLSTRMTVDQMTAYMGSTASQTRMVYSFSKSKDWMTPLEFAHFLTDDLFNRKALAAMVSKEQRHGMLSRTRIMDSAASGATFSKKDIDAMVLDYGLRTALQLDAAPAEQPASGQTVAEPEPAAAGPAPADTVRTVRNEQEQQQEPMVEIPEDPRLALLEQMLKPGRKYDARRMSRNFRALGENVDEFTVSLLYTLYGSQKSYDPEWRMDLEELVDYISENVMEDERFSPYISEDIKQQFGSMKSEITEGVAALKGPGHSIAAIITSLPDEAPETEAFVRSLEGDHYLIGESVMLCEMKDGFRKELRLITLLTILAIFTIVAITFRSPLTAAILVMAVMSSVFVNVVFCGIGGKSMLYLAYLIVQSILMGATIDYGILFTTYYREHRDLKEAYRGSIHTILTSGLIICCVPGAMALLLDDAMIQPIVRNLAVGSFAAIVIILFILPGVLSLVFPKNQKRKTPLIS